MKLGPLGCVVSPAFIIQPANTPWGASGMGIAVFIVHSKSHCYSSEMGWFDQHWCHDRKIEKKRPGRDRKL